MVRRRCVLKMIGDTTCRPNLRSRQSAGASIRNRIVTLEKVSSEHAADTTYIFGHAKAVVPVTGTRADLLAFRDYFTALLDYVQKGVAAGKPVEEITKVAALAGFPDHEGAPAGTLQMAFEELTSKS